MFHSSVKWSLKRCLLYCGLMLSPTLLWVELCSLFTPGELGATSQTSSPRDLGGGMKLWAPDWLGRELCLDVPGLAPETLTRGEATVCSRKGVSLEYQQVFWDCFYQSFCWILAWTCRNLHSAQTAFSPKKDFLDGSPSDSPFKHQAGQIALFTGRERGYSWHTQRSSEIYCRFSIHMTVSLWLRSIPWIHFLTFLV